MIEVEVSNIQNMATSNLMHHIVVILKDPTSCLNPIIFYFIFLTLCVFLPLSFFSLLFASLLCNMLVFLFFVICFRFVCCVGVCCCFSSSLCVHVIYNFIPLYINFVIKSSNIVIQAMRTASNIQWILFSKISRNVKTEIVLWPIITKSFMVHWWVLVHFGQQRRGSNLHCQSWISKNLRTTTLKWMQQHQFEFNGKDSNSLLELWAIRIEDFIQKQCHPKIHLLDETHGEA